MPTGYTADVADGKVTEFKDFALHCARGMGALIMLRDAPWNEALPDKLPTTDDYYIKALERHQEEMKALLCMNEGAIERAAEDHYNNVLAEWEKAVERNKEIRRNYQSMIDKVRAWEPPSPDHDGMKKFMLEQLQRGAEFDVHDNDEDVYPKKPEKLAPSIHHAREITQVAKDIAYHAEKLAEAQARDRERQEWWDALRESLK